MAARLALTPASMFLMSWMIVSAVMVRGWIAKAVATEAERNHVARRVMCMVKCDRWMEISEGVDRVDEDERYKRKELI